MKRRVCTLLVMGNVFALGCGSEEGSSEGLVRRVVFFHPRENALAEEIQKVEDAFRALPSEFPNIERFEGGKTNENPEGWTHCFIISFKDLQFRQDQAFGEAFDAAANGPYVRTPRHDYLAHDATPDARTPTRGRLRRVVSFTLKEGIAPEETKKIENAMVALPSQITAIERLEWGKLVRRQKDVKQALTEMATSRSYTLLLTFQDGSTRDECLAHPAFEEFQTLLQHHGAKPSAIEYVAQQ